MTITSDRESVVDLTILELGRGRQRDKEKLEPKTDNLKVRRAQME